MKCECECHCGQIQPRDAMNDRLYWVETCEGTKRAAWRGSQDEANPWIVAGTEHEVVSLAPDSGLRIIYEIIPEE